MFSSPNRSGNLIFLVYELPVMPFFILSSSQFPPFIQAWLPSPMSVGTLPSFHIASCFRTHASFQFSSVQSLGRVWLFVTLWTAAHLASLSITNSRSLLKFMPIQSVMPSNHLILCCPLLLLPSIFPSIRVRYFF